MQFGGIVLCGGRSTRMGLPKATLPFGPELMVERVVRLLRQSVEPIVVVAAPEQKLPDLPSEVLIARDEREGCGPLEGLYTGLTALAAHADAAYATSCDTPLLEPAFVQRIIASLGEHDVAVPIDGKFHHPLAAVYRTSVAPHIRRLLDAERMRPVFLYDEVHTLRVPVDDLRDIDPELNTLQNLNHPQDYLAALKIAGYNAPEAILTELRHRDV